jgi:hypothetical protein
MASESPWATSKVKNHYNLSDYQVTVESNNSLANFNRQLDMHIKYHPEGVLIVYSSKETKKSYRQLCMNKTAAVCLGPLYWVPASYFSYILLAYLLLDESFQYRTPASITHTSMKTFLCLPSPWTYSPMTIISIETWKQLAETTASVLSFVQGIENQNHHLLYPLDMHECSNSNKRLFGSDSGEDNLPGTDSTKSS